MFGKLCVITIALADLRFQCTRKTYYICAIIIMFRSDKTQYTQFYINLYNFESYISYYMVYSNTKYVQETRPNKMFL